MEAIERAIFHAVKAAELRGMALARLADRHSQAAGEFLEMVGKDAGKQHPSPSRLAGG